MSEEAVLRFKWGLYYHLGFTDAKLL